MRKLTVGKLIEILSEAPRDALVVVPGHDHSYRDAFAHVHSVLIDEYGEYIEDHGENMTPESEYGKRTTAVIVE